MDVSCRVKSGNVGLSRLKSGKVGRFFFLPDLVVVTVLHQFFRFESRFPVLAGSLQMLNHCSNRRLTHAGFLAAGGSASGLKGSCRFMSGQVGGRSGQSGQFSYFGL